MKFLVKLAEKLSFRKCKKDATASNKKDVVEKEEIVQRRQNGMKIKHLLEDIMILRDFDLRKIVEQINMSFNSP